MSEMINMWEWRNTELDEWQKIISQRGNILTEHQNLIEMN